MKIIIVHICSHITYVVLKFCTLFFIRNTFLEYVIYVVALLFSSFDMTDTINDDNNNNENYVDDDFAIYFNYHINDPPEKLKNSTRFVLISVNIM